MLLIAKTRFLRAMFYALGIVAALSGCTCEEHVFCGPDSVPSAHCHPDAGRDAGRDAGAADAGSDAARDARADAHDDAGLGDPMWVLLPDLPAGCEAWRAARPEQLSNLPWVACGDGCLRSNEGPSTFFASRGFFHAGRGWVAYVAHGSMPSTDLLVLASSNGGAVAAWTYPSGTAAAPTCWISSLDVDDGFVGAVLTFFADEDGREINERIYAGPIDSIRDVDTPVAILGSPYVGMTRHVEQLAVASDAIAMQISGGEIVVAHAGAITDAFAATAMSGGYNAGATGDHVVFSETIGQWRLMHWTPELGTTAYYDPVAEVGDPQLDGSQLVWIRYADLTDGGATRAELWTSTFERDPAALAPRMVHPSVNPTNAVLGDGLYGWLASDGVHLVEIASGAERLLAFPAGVVTGVRLLYVSTTDVLAECTASDLGAALYRLDPRVLSTPVP